MAEIIPWTSLLWCLVPVGLVTFLFYAWNTQFLDVLTASGRMVVQLLAVGYLLLILFERPSPWISAAIIAVMLVIANWIALRPVRKYKGLFVPGLIALSITVLFHLMISVVFVVELNPWYQPNVLIPLAGMYFANTMNSISLATERYYAELSHVSDVTVARNNAFTAAMIPQINGLLAVGLVALPGMMTGQILAGVSPLIAVRYQILIMTMILGTTGVGAALMLWQLSRKKHSVKSA